MIGIFLFTSFKFCFVILTIQRKRISTESNDVPKCTNTNEIRNHNQQNRSSVGHKVISFLNM